MDLLANMDLAAYIALVLVLAVATQVIAWRLGVPALVLLLIVGFGLGQAVVPDEILGQDLLFGGTMIAVGIILFEGALSLNLREIRDLGAPVIRLCSVVVAIAWVGIALAGMAVGLNVGLAFLLGAILVVTGPTVIGPILRTLRPTKRTSLMLTWEGIIVDPIGAALAVLVFQALVAGSSDSPVLAVASGLGLTLLAAFGVALPVAWLMEVAMRRHVIPDHLEGVTFLSFAVGALMASNAIQSESGLLTVTVMGVYLANRPGLQLEHIREFKENLQVLFIGGLFIVLAGRVTPEQLLGVLPQALALAVLLVLVVRPVSIHLGLLGTNVSKEEVRLLSGMAPRGIVAAAVVSTFAQEFQHYAEERADAAAAAPPERAESLRQSADRLSTIAGNADELVAIAFIVIVITVALYGLGVGRLARRLGLAADRREGVLFVGSSAWAVQAAQRLNEEGVATLNVARDYTDLAGARRAGVPNVAANILSEYAVRDLDMSGIKSLVAGTGNDETNATSGRQFAQVLGRANVYQLARAEELATTSSSRWVPAEHLSARTAFQPPSTFDELDELIEQGAVVKRTGLSREFTSRDFRDFYGDDAVVMFVVEDGVVTVVDQESELPHDTGALIALVVPKDRETTQLGEEAKVGRSPEL
ncbi:sodium:proton antiporter [Nocardioidaceae bacterium]|nr:sodium:proton antiporter [Nocardioidaceae bacterium]